MTDGLAITSQSGLLVHTKKNRSALWTAPAGQLPGLCSGGESKDREAHFWLPTRTCSCPEALLPSHVKEDRYQERKVGSES